MDAFFSVFQLNVLIPWLLAMILGIFVGGIPGLTATMAVALIVPLTYHMQPVAGLAMIIGVSFTSIFAGDIPATFLRVPGTPASGAAVLDGYQMNLKGQGSLAVTLDLICSCIGGFIGIMILILIAPALSRFALKFTHFEYSMSAIISKGSRLKGAISMIIGVLISTIGIDVTTGYPRFAKGNIQLMGGIEFIPIMIGLFGISEVFRSIYTMQNMKVPVFNEEIKVSFKSLGKILNRNKRLIAQSSVIGTLIGALPGAGADIAAWVSYGLAKRTSKRPDDFGSGSEEGVIAPTSANNAAIGGTWIPALVFGIPGDTITAIVLGAMMMYGLKPGPLVFEGERFLVNQIFSVGLVSQVFLLVLGYKFPRNVILAGIMIFSMVGSYAIRNNIFDVGVVLVFGIVGFAMERAAMPLAPLILGRILGPMIEENLRIGLIKTSGSFAAFINRPISFSLFLILVVMFLWDPVKKIIVNTRARAKAHK
jgi:TctA family transporter